MRWPVASASLRPIAPMIVGALIALFGLVLTLGGAWLLALDGSAYYLVAGVAMMTSGMMLYRRYIVGGWIFVAIFVGSVFWAFAEVGPQGWALLPRVVALMVLLIAVFLVMPTLSVSPLRWKAGIGAAAVTVLLAAVATMVFARINAPAPLRDLPPLELDMADTALLLPGADWPAYGGSYSARRFSPLGQITPENVGSLRRAWSIHTGDMPSRAAKDMYGAENTPLKIGNLLYICTPKNIVLAVDPATGEEQWRFDPQVSDDSIPYTAACRGVSYFVVPDAGATEACASRLIYGTLDARLLAIDARTGRRCAAFGSNGEVDTTIGMGETPPGFVSITSPPTIVRGIVVTGHQVLDGQDRWAPSGVIRAYDAVSGELRWAWDMMHPDWSGYPPEGETWARGTPNMWTAASGDEQLGLVYLPMGNASADYYSSLRRPEEREYATSLVAIDVLTGKPAWRFKAVYNDVWDYDFGAQATLVDWQGVPALILPSKQGDIYVLDRRTGQPLTPVGEMRVPSGGVEAAQRTPAQPVSLWHTLRKPDLTERDMWGMSPIDQMICRIQFRRAAYAGPYTPPESGRRTIQYPGYNGGTDWGGIAVDPRRGVIIANYNDMPNYVQLVPREEADRMGWAPRNETRGGFGGAEGAGDPQANTPYAVDVNAGWRLPVTAMLCKQPPYGGIRAIDLRTGDTIWDRPFGQARRNGPFRIPSMLPVEIGTPNNGGPVVTASGLIFIAAATDNLIRAIDLRTGETLWSDVLPAGGQATPMTYAVNGRQYVVIHAGGHHFMETPIGDEVIAYALP